MDDMLAAAPYKVKEGQVIKQPSDEIWARSTDDVKKLASKIIDGINANGEYIDLACIGPAALNQGVKGLAVAREMLAEARIDLMAQPYFSTIEDDKQRSRTRLVLRITYLELAG